MKTPVPSAVTFLQLGAIAIAIAACSADLGGPKEGLSIPTRAALNEPIANEISLVDADDGVVYTLDVTNSEIRMDDGRVLELTTPDQVNDAITAFYGTASSDTSSESLMGVISSSCPHPDSGGCYEPQNRVLPIPEPRVNGSSSGIQRPQAGGGALSIQLGGGRPPALIRFDSPRANDPDSPRQRRRHPAKPARAEIHDLVVASLATWRFASSMEGDPCNDIATDAAQRKMEYHTGRTSWIKDVWAVAVVEAGNALKKYIPYGSAAATKLEESIANHETLRLNVNILAWVWNSYNCANRADVIAGPLYLHGAGGGGGGSGLSCDLSHGEISFDGGITWYGVWIKTCYAAQ